MERYMLYDLDDNIDNAFLEGYYDAMIDINEGKGVLGMIGGAIKGAAEGVVKSVIKSPKSKKPKEIGRTAYKNTKGQKITKIVFDDGTIKLVNNETGNKTYKYADGGMHVVNKDNEVIKEKKPDDIVSKTVKTVKDKTNDVIDNVKEKVDDVSTTVKSKITDGAIDDEVNKRKEAEKKQQKAEDKLEKVEEENEKLRRVNNAITTNNAIHQSTKSENKKLKKTNRNLKIGIGAAGAVGAGIAGYKLYKHLKKKKEEALDENIQYYQNIFDTYFTEDELIEYLIYNENLDVNSAIAVCNEGFANYIYSRYIL